MAATDDGRGRGRAGFTGVIPQPADPAALLDTLRARGAPTPPVSQLRYIAEPASTPILATVGVCDSVTCRATLIAQLDLRAPIAAAVGDTATGFHFSVEVGGRELARSAPPTGTGARFAIRDSVALGNLELVLTTWPTPAMLARSRSRLPNLVLVLGLSVAILATLAVKFSRDAHRAAEREADVRAADLAERRRMERILREVEGLSLMGRLAARVAHEINNPLGGIQNSFLLVKDAISPTHPHFKYVGAIDREIQRIAIITRQLYETYRPEQDSSPSAAVHSLINDAAAFLQQVNRPRGIRITVDLARAPAIVEIPASLLRQCVHTLVQNAIDASPDNTSVDVSAAIERGAFVLRVRDRGPVITPERQERLFEPFSAGGEFNAATDGPALGLSLVRRSVQSVGGTIAIEQPLDGGAEFVVRFPLTSHAGVTPS